MSDFQKKTAKLLLQSSKNLAQMIPGESFTFWKEKEFRAMVSFDTLSQTEQDRIFNELEVSLLGLFDLHFTYIEALTDQQLKNTVTILKKEVVKSFIDLFVEAGVEEKHIKLWKALIDMRLKEYWRDYQIAMKEASSWKEFANDNQARVVWARIETITIDCLTHIRRGNVKEGDPLWKHLRKWFIEINTKLLPLEKLTTEA